MAVGLAGCTGSGDDSGSDDPLAEAQAALTETSGVDLAMSTEKLPAGTDGFVRLVGTLTDAPAFDGDVRVFVNDITEDIPMVVVDGAVYAQLPYTDGVFAEIDPAAYGTPDPAELMDPEHGLAGWLAATTGAEEDGGTVTGEVPGDVVAALVPSADPKGTFEAEYELDDEQRLERAVVSGPFYKGSPAVAYTIEVSQYDVDENISKPDLRDR